MPGASEPGEKTYVTPQNRRKLLAVADETGWRSVLTLLAKLVREKGLAKVIPKIDHGRIKFFVKQWSEELEQGGNEQSDGARSWLGPVLEAFGGTPLKQRSTTQASSSSAAAAAVGRALGGEITYAATDAASIPASSAVFAEAPTAIASAAASNSTLSIASAAPTSPIPYVMMRSKKELAQLAELAPQENTMANFRISADGLEVEQVNYHCNIMDALVSSSL
jgi:hypothetical protein